jgi:hypothetical protein
VRFIPKHRERRRPSEVKALPKLPTLGPTNPIPRVADHRQHIGRLLACKLLLSLQATVRAIWSSHTTQTNAASYNATCTEEVFHHIAACPVFTGDTASGV